jgi:hypothetical protein
MGHPPLLEWIPLKQRDIPQGSRSPVPDAAGVIIFMGHPILPLMSFPP